MNIYDKVGLRIKKEKSLNSQNTNGTFAPIVPYSQLRYKNIFE